MARGLGESPMATVSRKTGTATAVADGMGCGADTSGLAGLSTNRYDRYLLY